MHANNNIIRYGRSSFSLLLLFLCALLAGSCTNRQAMQERLGYVSSCNRADTVFTVRWLPAVDSLVCYFDHHGTPNERLMAYYLQGRVHHDMGEAPQAIDCYQKAVEKADTTADDCDYHTLTAVYGQMAQLYRNQFLPDDEIAALRLAARMANLEHNTLSGIIAIQRLAGPYFMKSDTDSVLIVEKQARELYLKHGYPEYAAQAVLSSIWIALNRQDLTEAERLLTLYRNESGLFDNNGESARGGAYYLDKGIYMTHLEMLDSALYYFHKAIKHGLYEGGYKGLLSVYEKMNRPDSISKYARLFAAANDSSFLHVNQETVHRISALYNYSRQQRIAEEQAEQARRANLQKRVLIFCIVLLIVASIIGARQLKNHAKSKYLKLSAAYEKNKAELTAAIDRQRLLRYDYEEALKGKDEERQQQFLQIQDEIRQKESEIDLLKKKTRLQEEQLQQFSSTGLEKAFKKSNIFRLFNKHKKPKYINDIPSEEDWHELTELFRTHYVRFNTFITSNCQLSTNQYRYCMLLRLGFDNAEIGILMNKDKDQKYHLRKFACEALFGKTANVKDFDTLLKEHY